MPDRTFIHLRKNKVMHTSFEAFSSPSGSSLQKVYYVPVRGKSSDAKVVTRAFVLLERFRLFENKALPKKDHMVYFNTPGDTFQANVSNVLRYLESEFNTSILGLGCGEGMSGVVCLYCLPFVGLPVLDSTIFAYVVCIGRACYQWRNMHSDWIQPYICPSLYSDHMFSEVCPHSLSSRSCPYGTCCRFIHLGECVLTPSH